MGRRAAWAAVPLLAVLPVPSAAVPAVGVPAPGFAPERGLPGRVPGNIQDHAWIVAEHIQARPHEYAGAAVTATAIEVMLPPGDDLQSRKDRVDALVGAPVRFIVVPRSQAQLDSLRAELQKLLVAGTYGDRVTGIGPDPTLGAVVVYLRDDLPDADTADIRYALGERYGDAVAFRKMAPIELVDLSGR